MTKRRFANMGIRCFVVCVKDKPLHKTPLLLVPKNHLHSPSGSTVATGTGAGLSGGSFLKDSPRGQAALASSSSLSRKYDRKHEDGELVLYQRLFAHAHEAIGQINRCITQCVENALAHENDDQPGGTNSTGAE